MKTSATATDFLRAIFGEKPAASSILIWQLNKLGAAERKENKFFTDIEAAAAFAASQKPAGTNIYIGMGTLASKPKSGRGKKDDISGIGAVWLDVDIQHPLAHRKNNLPPTMDDAMAFVNSIDLKPSIIVNSGFGCHIYWLLDGFWSFSNEDDRAKAGRLVENWQKLFKLCASQLGYDVDSTQDLSRVLRLPDTLNWKVPEQPVTAQIISFDDSLRYTPGDFDSFLSQNSQPLPSASTNGHQKAQKNTANLKSFNDIQIEVNENADIGHDVLARLKKLPKFSLTWERKRTDMLDQSASAYDMSLANFSVRANLTDQQTANLLISHRRNHGDEKLRLDYLQRTISEARNGMRQQREVDDALKIPADLDDKDKIRHAIQTVLGVRIERIEKMATHPPEFTIFFAGDAKINIGNSKGLYKQDDFRRFVGDAINKAPAKLKGDAWESIVQKLFALVEVVQPGEDLSEEGLFKEQIQSFLTRSDIYKNEDEYTQKLTDAFSENFNMAGMIGDSLCIQAENLWQHIKMKYDRQTERKRIIINLKKIGANRLTKKVRLGKKTTSYSLYALPEDFTKSVIEQTAAETDEPDYVGKQNRLSTELGEWQM